MLRKHWNRCRFGRGGDAQGSLQYGIVNVDLYSAMVTEVSNALLELLMSNKYASD